MNFVEKAAATYGPSLASKEGMRGGFRIGRLFGIDLTVDASWLFIFLLIFWNLTAVFSAWHPSWSLPVRTGVALVAGLLFFASVLAHELAHALVAKGYGIPVSNITLFLFGGVSNLEREPHAPHVELMTAVVGPLVSVGLGIAFVVGASLLAPIPAEGFEHPEAYLATLGPLATILHWLGPVNIVLGIFNMIPGFPLDGGRVLRALLWKGFGDLHRATRWASTSGRWIGWGFVGLGLLSAVGAVPWLGTGIFGGLWLAFIGWFLSSAARQSYESLIVDELLQGLTVARLMRRNGPLTNAETSVNELVHEGFIRLDEHALPVFSDDEFVGLVCQKDVRKVASENWPITAVDQIMAPVGTFETASPRDAVSNVLRRLSQLDLDQMPVLEDGRLVGMLERRDIAKWLELHLERGGPPFGRAQPRPT